jgi:ribosomal protein S5
MDTNVKALLDKAAQANESHNAMNFAQAALNAAHALQVLKQIEAK